MPEKKLSIEEFINTILGISNEELFYNEQIDAQSIFLGGECYEFALVLKEFITNSVIVIDNKNEHCAVQFQGRIYDSRGDVTNTFKGRIAREEDIDYMEDRFGVPEKSFIDGQRISKYLINYIKKCRFIDRLPFYSPKEEVSLDNNRE